MGFISINIKPLLSYDLPERFYEELADSDGDWTKSGWLSDNVLQDLQKTSYIEYLIEKFGHRVEEKVSIGQQKNDSNWSIEYHFRNLSKRWVTFENIQKEILYGYQDTNIYPPTQVIASTNQIIEAFRNVLQVRVLIFRD